MGYPLSAMQLLWINLMSDIFPSLALALEPPGAPHSGAAASRPKEPIIGRSGFQANRGRIRRNQPCNPWRLWGWSGPLRDRDCRPPPWLSRVSHSPSCFTALSCRSEKLSIYDKEKLPPNKYLNMALGGSLGLQLLTFVVPGLRSLLGTAPINLFDAAAIGIGSILPLLVNEATKGKSWATTLPARERKDDEK